MIEEEKVFGTHFAVFLNFWSKNILHCFCSKGFRRLFNSKAQNTATVFHIKVISSKNHKARWLSRGPFTKNGQFGAFTIYKNICDSHINPWRTSECSPTFVPSCGYPFCFTCNSRMIPIKGSTAPLHIYMARRSRVWCSLGTATKRWLQAGRIDPSMKFKPSNLKQHKIFFSKANYRCSQMNAFVHLLGVLSLTRASKEHCIEQILSWISFVWQMQQSQWHPRKRKQFLMQFMIRFPITRRKTSPTPLGRKPGFLVCMRRQALYVANWSLSFFLRPTWLQCWMIFFLYWLNSLWIMPILSQFDGQCCLPWIFMATFNCHWTCTFIYTGWLEKGNECFGVINLV